MSFENERETVREELSRIDEMINSETVAEPVVPPEDEPVRAAHSDDEEQEEQPERKSRPHGSLYEMISELGDFVLTRVGFVLTLIFKVIKYPFAKFAKFFNRVTESTKLRIRKYMAATLDETAFSAGKYARRANPSARRSATRCRSPRCSSTTSARRYSGTGNCSARRRISPSPLRRL